MLTFDGLVPDRWFELSAPMRADPAEEAVDVGDFAAVGIEFRAPDGSGIDFGRVPGLQQTGMDAHGAWLAGPLGGSARTLPDLRLCFHLPAPACQVVVTIRSWRNSHVVHVDDPILRQMPVDMPGSGAEAGTTATLGRDRIVLGREPTWFHYGLVPGRPITLRGQLVRTEASDGAFVAIAYRDRAGALIAPPYPGVMATPSLPAWLSVRGPSGPVYTRDGRMKLSAAGELQDLEGRAVLDPGGSPLSVNPENGPIFIGRDGMISQGRDQIGALGVFRLDPGAVLTRVNGAAVSSSTPGQAVLDFNQVGATSVSVQQGFQEGANVNPVMEMSRLIMITRNFESAATAVAETESSMQNAIRTLGPAS
ncbi:flagellar basal body rod C-terminal domain-containing protein [Methylobacterium sp. J-092]|uniref:flagellar basal body rod C-terminal domain-containing protein n=1 Tax=Methylobacterium sp. J-092 TaxID=2836667 RepID=UPI001FBAA598|nr:flagellar basal body rod C-terminal domain-containing protein [Methylobacterium sp. J-092]